MRTRLARGLVSVALAWAAVGAAHADTQRVAAQLAAVRAQLEPRLYRTALALCAALGGAVFLSYGMLRHDAPTGGVPALQLGVWVTASFKIGRAHV